MRNLTAFEVILNGLMPSLNYDLEEEKKLKERDRRDAGLGFTWIKCKECRKWFVDIKNLECPFCHKERR
jgi:hypothetical protein